MTSNYYQLIERIAKSAGVSVDEINRQVEAKRAKLSGLISREGAAQIIASELGVNFEKQLLKVNELVSGMKKVNIVGKITRMFPVREYKKENREGKIGNFMIADETGMVRCVLWDTNHIKLIEDRTLKEGCTIDISNSSVRNSEIHLTGFSDIKISDKTLDNVKTKQEFRLKKLSNIKIGESVKTRSFVVQAFEPRFFEVCPECNSKVIESAEGSVCEKHGRVIPSKRALISLVLDDGYGNIRAVLFTENIEKLLNLEELKTDFVGVRDKLLGDEIIFSGSVRQNKMFNNLELFVSDIERINADQIIEQLEKAK